MFDYHHEPCDTTCRVNSDLDDTAADTDCDRPDPRPCPLHPLVLTTEDGQPLGGYARPVVNVTVPITALAGSRTAGGRFRWNSATGRLPPPPRNPAWRHLVPLLTDTVGRFLAPSTASYQLTGAIARPFTCRDQTCVLPGCRRPSVACHLGHRVPQPEGRTCADNLAPLCLRHHQLKHADGYDVVRNSDGSHTWTTRHGSTFTAPASEQPVPTQSPPRQEPDGQRGLP